MAGSGVVLGVGFDIIEVLVREFKLRRFATGMLDVGYWFVATLFVFQVLVYANDGQVRIFIFIGLFIGVVIYFYLLSRAVRLTVTSVLTLLLWLYRGIIRVLHVLLIKPLLYIYRLIQIVIGFLLAVSMFLGKIVLQWTKYVLKFFMRRS